MIYFDCAATSLQKPPSVATAVFNSVRMKSSPGRGGHYPATLAANSVYECRELLAEFFNFRDPERIVFTSNATHALNIAINTLVSAGDTVVISGYEHNAVARPLNALGANVRVAASPLFEPEKAIAAFKRAIPGAKCVVCTHVSNVFGYILPIKEIAQLCRNSGVPLIVDASQSAGAIPIDFTALGAEFMAMPGHKGLLGPQGTGVLLCGRQADPIIFGGTGSASKPPAMPEFLPDRLEAGTHNVPGISGLSMGVQYLTKLPNNAVLSHEHKLLKRFLDRMRNYPNLKIFAAKDLSLQAGVVSIVSSKMDCEELTDRLGRNGICVRGSFHCAPLAHKTAGTYESGTVRFSFSPFNTLNEVDQGCYILKNILNNAQK